MIMIYTDLIIYIYTDAHRAATPRERQELAKHVADVHFSVETNNR